MSNLSAALSLDIFSIREVKNIAAKTEEQVILIFGCCKNELHVLCGESQHKTWAVMPSVNMIIDWIKKKEVCFKEVLIVHNHPHISWYREIVPSEQDLASTELLKWQLALLGIKLVDHIIVSKNKKCSLFELDLYNNNYLKIDGFEIKRFLYCFLVQLSIILEDNVVLDSIINALEKNLDIIKNYYEKNWLIKIFKTKPIDNNFNKTLSTIKTNDCLINKLISFLINLKDDYNIKIKPGDIIPLGQVLQKNIITSQYNLKV